MQAPLWATTIAQMNADPDKNCIPEPAIVSGEVRDGGNRVGPALGSAQPTVIVASTTHVAPINIRHAGIHRLIGAPSETRELCFRVAGAFGHGLLLDRVHGRVSRIGFILYATAAAEIGHGTGRIRRMMRLLTIARRRSPRAQLIAESFLGGQEAAPLCD
jgi:hypothetical protein